MTENESNSKQNEVVILSDDEEEDDQQINENGKRAGGPQTDERLGGPKHQQDLCSEELYEEYTEDENIEGYEEEIEYFDSDIDSDDETLTITRNQTLPEDHEPVIISERAQVNPLKELDDIFTEFKSQCIKDASLFNEMETSFACGCLLKKTAPNAAMNVEGVSGPIAFPFEDKDAERIFSAYPTATQKNERGQPVCLELETAKTVINLTFLEYLFESILPDIVSCLGVEQDVANKTRLQANKLYIHANGGKFDLPSTSQNGAYGTAILVLPSNFKGGDTFAEYHGEEILFHNDRTSAEGAYYMAWYNDVDIKSEPVMTGYRIAIVFSLIHDIETAAENASIIKYLQEKRVLMSKGLLSAKEEQKSKIYLERATEYLESQKAKMKYPIVYMLDYNYTSPSLTVNQLKCSDKIIARFLETVAEKAGYLCFLGSVEREVEGKVNESNNLVTTESTNKNDDCPIDEEGIYLTQCSLYDDYILTRLIDSSGKNILEKPVGLDSKNQPVIIQGVSWYARCKPDSEDFSGTVNVKEVTVKYWYSNTSAVAFLPKENLPAVLEMSQLSDY